MAHWLVADVSLFDPTEKEHLLKRGEERRRQQAMAKQTLAERAAPQSIKSPRYLLWDFRAAVSASLLRVIDAKGRD
jgi:hypothetical protein